MFDFLEGLCQAFLADRLGQVAHSSFAIHVQHFLIHGHDVDGDVAGRRREILGAMERGAFVVTEFEEIEEMLTGLVRNRDGCEPGEQGGNGEGRGIGNVVEKILGDDGSGPSGVSKGSSFRKEDFALTNDELDALLGA